MKGGDQGTVGGNSKRDTGQGGTVGVVNNEGRTGPSSKWNGTWHMFLV
jgi:hypothetical protein